MSSNLMSCPECRWYECEGVNVYCTSPAVCNSIGDLYSLKWDNTTCGRFEAVPSAKSCGQCFWYDPTKEFCSEQAIHQIEFFIKSDTVVCEHFFEPVDPEHTCGECEHYHEMLSSKAVCKNKKISKIYKKEDLADHLACKKHFKKKEEVHTCGECKWYVTNEAHCAWYDFHKLSAVFACEDFKPRKTKLDPMKVAEVALGLKPKSVKQPCNTCKHLSSNKECCSHPYKDLTLQSACSRYEKKKPKRTCGECHYFSDFPHSQHTSECLQGDISNIVTADLDATDCGAFAPIVKAKDGSVCYSCRWITDSKDHCVYRTEPGADFPKGDKCAFYTLQPTSSDDIEIVKSEPNIQMIEHTCKECEHFGILTNSKSICGTEDNPQLYAKADQIACKEHFKPKPSRPNKMPPKLGQRKIKWQDQ